MPEYFDISLIIKKKSISKINEKTFLKHIGLHEGKNQTNMFERREIIATPITDEYADYIEICISICGLYFHIDHFDEELREITDFVNICFNDNPNIKYALCSYELNGYLIGEIKKISAFSHDHFLNRFPIVYKREFNLAPPLLKINLDAQNIFV